MTRMDQRIRSVELRPINLLTDAEVASAVTIGAPSVGPETVVSASAPYQFRKVQDAYVYPKGLIGKSTDRVEIYLEADLGVEAGDRIEVSGIHWASSSAVDVDGDNFTVESIDTPPWTGRASYMHDPAQDQLSGVTISHAYYFQPETAAPTSWSSRRRLQTRRKVDSYEISAAPNSTVTLTMNATHHFEVGDVIFVDIFAENSTAYGPDGLFYITAVTSTTIEYVLSAGVDVAVPSTDVSADDIYVFPVAREWAQDGSIWVDSSNNETYYWNGIRWVDYTPGAVASDGDPPSAPTGLSASFEMGYGPNGGSVAVTQATLSWTAPTTSESGGTLTDLYAYRIKYQLDPSGDWITLPDIADPSLTSYTFGELFTFEKSTSSTTKTYNFRVYAIDSGGEVSAAATASADTPEAPATNITTVKPVLSNDPPYLGTVTLYWNGTVTNALGSTQSNPEGIYYVEIHRSTSATFTASDATLIGTTAAVPNAKFVDGSLSNAYGTTFYYVAVIVDGNGTRSVQSNPPLAVTAQSNVDVAAIQGIIDAAGITPGTIVTGEEIIGLNITGQLIRGVEINAGIIEANSITADKLDVGNVTAQIVDSRLFTSRTVTGTSPVTYTGAGITFDDTGLYAYDSGGTPTLSIVASTGAVTIGNYVQTGTLSNYVTNSSLTSTLSSYATVSSLGLYVTASDASSTYLTQVNAGSLYIAKGDAATDINDNSTTIDGGKITTNTLSANSIKAGTFTGSTFQTASADRRVLISSSSNSIKFYDTGDNTTDSQRGTIIGTLSQMRIYGPANNIYQTMSSTTYQLIVNSGTTITANSSSFVLQSGGSSALDIGSSYSLLRSPSSSTQIYMDSSSILFDGVVSASSPAYVFQGASDTLRVEDLGGTTASTISAFASGTLYRGTGSDERLKENIVDMSNALGIINASRPVTFTYKADAGFGVGSHYGLIAQELAAILPEDNTVISTTKIEGEDDTDYYTIEYQRLIPILMGAVKELSSQVQALTTRIEALET